MRGQEGKNAPEPELLARLARYDSALIAPGYGLDFPLDAEERDAELVALATEILAAQPQEDFPLVASAVSDALWRANSAAMRELADRHGCVLQEVAQAALEAGTQRRRELKHYSGAMFHYGGEWYWGVDRLYHLEDRLAALGADSQPGAPLIAPRPTEDMKGRPG